MLLVYRGAVIMLPGRVSDMRHRKSANRRSDKKSFSRHAGKTHSRNLRATPMRGGFRI